MNKSSSRQRWSAILSNRPKTYLRKKTGSIIGKACVYLLLIELSFIFLLPLLTIVTKSFKGMADLLNPMIYWLPTRLVWENYQEAFVNLVYPRTFFNAVWLVTLNTVTQTFMCAMAGYALGRYKFPGHRVVFFLVVLCIIVPEPTISIQRYYLFAQMDMLVSYWPLVLPELFGHGLRGALFVLIFSQFFKNVSPSLEEAARIDGAGGLKTFLRIMLPMAKPAIVLVAIFSCVWHYNDTYSHNMYLNNATEYMTVMDRFEVLYDAKYGSDFGTDQLHTLQDQAVMMAAAVLCILPIIVFYLLFQKQFTQGIERTGLVE